MKNFKPKIKKSNGVWFCIFNGRYYAGKTAQKALDIALICEPEEAMRLSAAIDAKKKLAESVAKAKRVEKAAHTILVVMGIAFAIAAAITIAWQPA